jgi:hypothetical protein
MGTSGVITNDNDDFEISDSEGIVVQNATGGVGITNPRSIGFTTSVGLGASMYYAFLAPVNGLYIDSDGDIVLDAAASVDVTGSMEVNGNITTKASSFVTNAAGGGIQMGVGADGDFFMNPTLTSPNFSKEFRYDRTEDRWRSKVDLRTDADLIYVGSLIDASDESIKENIESVGSCLDILSQIDP